MIICVRFASQQSVVGLNGLGPSTSRLSGGCSNQLSYKPVWLCPSSFSPFASSEAGGDEGVRTPDPLLAGQVLSQLSYTPVCIPSGYLPGLSGLATLVRTEYLSQSLSLGYPK